MGARGRWASRRSRPGSTRTGIARARVVSGVVGRVHALLTNPVYAGKLRFNRMDSKSRRLKSEGEYVYCDAPPIISVALFEAVQKGLAARNPNVVAAADRQRSDPAHRARRLRHLWRRHDAESRHIPNGTGLSLLLLCQRHPERQARLQGPVDPDGQARHARDRAPGRPPATARAADHHAHGPCRSPHGPSGGTRQSHCGTDQRGGSSPTKSCGGSTSSSRRASPSWTTC